MKGRSAHGGGSLEAPEDGLGGGRGGSNSLDWFGLGFFSFFCLADMGKRRSGSPGLTLSKLGAGIGLKAGKWVRCPARAAV